MAMSKHAFKFMGHIKKANQEFRLSDDIPPAQIDIGEILYYAKNLTFKGVEHATYGVVTGMILLGFQDHVIFKAQRKANQTMLDDMRKDTKITEKKLLSKADEVAMKVNENSVKLEDNSVKLDAVLAKVADIATKK